MPPSSDRKTISGSRPRERRSASTPSSGSAVADQRQRGELPRPDRPVAAREVGVGRCEEDVRVGEDGDALEGGVVVVAREREVELAPREEVEQVVVVARLDEAHLNTGPAVDVTAHRLREEPHARALERSHAERPGLTLGERRQVRLGRAHRGCRALCVAQEPQPGLGRRHRPPSARPLEQCEPGGALERRDLLADRGLRVAELCCRPVEGAGLDDGLEGREMANLDAR